MEKEPSDKLIGIQRHDLFFVTVGVITPQERYFAILKLENTVIADGYSVGISAEVLKDSFYAVKWRLAIDDPLLMFELSPKSFESMRVFEVTDRAGEDEITRFKTVFEIVQELTPEQLRQNLYMNEEVLTARHPAVSLRRQSASGNNTVNMRMLHEVLPPCVQYSYETDSCTEMLRII
jgi:hypothetical protein